MSSFPGWVAGDRLEEVWLPPVTRLQLIKYAGASGDYNPIHTIDTAAEEAGLPGVIAHGMLTVATMGRLFSPYLELGYVKTFGSRFSGMVFLGDELFVGGEATGIEELEEGLLYNFEVYAKKEQGIVVAGEAGFLMYRSL
ncbi:MAG: MaoC/PaaZ C-terminal domain-containing protein [Rubrobacteraceae bacterium]